jgi:heterodisulfide reductase subunit C
MEIVSQLLFVLLLSASVYYIYKSVSRIKSNILSGRAEDRSGNIPERIKMMVLLALGQKKMFKKPIPAILHLFIYLGFLIVNIEMLEIVLDGVLGTHRVFSGVLGRFYPLLINFFEFFAVSVIAACVVFLIRRNIWKVKRFEGLEMTSKPKLDANIILVVEILLMKAFLLMNASDSLLQSVNPAEFKPVGTFIFSAYLIPMLSNFSESALHLIERASWWFHIIGVLAFANYVFYDSKHLHIFMAFINTYYSRLVPMGSLSNMKAVTQEVNSMLGIANNQPVETFTGKFGAKDATDLTWKNLLDSYSCTECGRCTQQCPANMTGKKLSPRKIMMDTRDRIEEIGKNKSLHGKDYDDGKSLLHDYITTEEILACTTCNACAEACPVNIDPVNIIMQLRQYQLMEASQAPSSWNAMLSNIENNFAPWKFSPSDRFAWVEKLTK